MPYTVRIPRSIVRIGWWLALVAACWQVVGCDHPRRQALRELSRLGVEPSGRSLLAAVTRGDRQQAALLIAAGVFTGQRDALGRTPLRVAVDLLDPRTVAMLLEAGADVHSKADDGLTALASAATHAETGMAAALLAHGARTDGPMADGEKILPWAIREGRLGLVRLMMEAGADPHLWDLRGNPLLHLAMERGHREVTAALIELGADAGSPGPAGGTVMHLAMARGWLDLLPRLANAGADPNAPDAQGYTPLARALAGQDGEAVKCLLACRADPDLPDPSGTLPLTLAVQRRDGEGLAALLAAGANPAVVPANGRPPLHAALAAGWREGAECLARVGSANGLADAGGRRPLDEAIDRRDLTAVVELVCHGAPLHFRGAGGRLPVERAAAAGWGSAVKLLMDYGAEPGGALQRACASGDRATARLLLACGAPASGGPGPWRDSPLATALRVGDDGTAAWLVRLSGGNPRLPGGQRALALAAARACPQAVRALLEEGADPNEVLAQPADPSFLAQVRPGVMRWVLREDRRVTPLMLAADAGCPETAAHLIRAGARKDVWTRDSRLWPINFAARRSDVAMMRTLLGKPPEPGRRRLVVSLSAQNVRMFDDAGQEVFKAKVSTGRNGYATPAGAFVITNKNRDWRSTIYHVRMPFFLRLSCGDFGLHQGNVPGYPASHGCIRVPAGKAEELFSLAEIGDAVEITP